jgi:L,D-peptidoglycan transpeptidase YkuD (ErfK/YbiS/YcfS/YnhG family)
LRSLAAADGWCDDPADADYNRFVQLPHPARCEALWRADALYDLLIVVGYNDDPVQPGRGSAIFIHVAKAGYAPTEGCLALALPDLQDLVATAAPGDVLVT